MTNATRQPLVFASVRDPYERVVSSYKYIVEERGIHAGSISFGQMLGGQGGPDLQMGNYMYGKHMSESHWREQMPQLLAACRYTRVRAFRVEPDAMLGNKCPWLHACGAPTLRRCRRRRLVDVRVRMCMR